MTANAISPVAARWIRAWLVLIGLLVYATILVGGATRLTDSGLSVTEWRPVTGALPPMDAASWAEEFEKYRSTTQYALQNQGMSLSEFQFIYWWEWGHRQLGRFIGFVAAVGFAAFAIRGWLGNGLAWKLLGLIALGGLQGAIGWWMVSSGMGDTTRVSVAPYRLMTHFSLALLILCFTTWLWLSLGDRPREAAPGRARCVAVALLALVFVQMAAGALVAGLDAGRTYNDWPLMAGELIPSHYIQADLGIRSFFEGRATTQFNHRILAYTLLATSLAAAWRYRATALSREFNALAILVTAQALWGIHTLLNAAPLYQALLHQALGVIVTLAAVHLVWRASTPIHPQPAPA